MRKDTAVPQGELESARLAAERINNNLDGRKPTYYIETYGCQMNEHDSEKIAGILERCGYVPAADKAAANIIFFNTCCVRDHAEKKVFGNIGALKKVKDENPSLIIGVCGCMMQQKRLRTSCSSVFRTLTWCLARMSCICCRICLKRCSTANA